MGLIRLLLEPRFGLLGKLGPLTVANADSALALSSHLQNKPVTADALYRSAGILGLMTVQDIQRAVKTAGFDVHLGHLKRLNAERIRALRPYSILLFKKNRTTTPDTEGFDASADRSAAVFLGIEADTVLFQSPDQKGVSQLSLTELGSIWQGEFLTLMAGEHDDSHEHRPFGLHSLLPEVRRYPGTVSRILMASFCLQIFALVIPLFTMVIIDKVLGSGSLSTLHVLVIALVMVALFDFILSGARKSLFAHTTSRVDVTLAAQMYQHLLNLPMMFYTTRATGDTVTRVRELESLRAFLSGAGLSTLVDLPFACLFLTVMFWFNPWITLGVALVAASLLVMYGVIGPVLRERLQAKFAASTDTQSLAVESIVGMHTLKAQEFSSQMQHEWERCVLEQARLGQKVEALTALLEQVSSLAQKLTTGGILLFGAMAVLDGKMTAGQLIAMNMIAGRVLAPVLRIGQGLQQLHQTGVSVRRVGEVFDAKPEPKSAQAMTNLPPTLEGRVEWQNVSFAYDEESPVLEEISLSVEPGEVIGIVGASGSGKSTFLSLMQRLYLPTQGRIKIDGLDIANVQPDWLRRQCGVVLQESLLLNRSVFDNLAMRYMACFPNGPVLDMERVVEAARLAGADEMIRGLPQNYDTVVGERGIRLSCGQRQRIALARALITDPAMLFLDEATSSLDSEAEKAIQENLQEICQGRTVFIAAHRLSTLRIADRVIVLDEGRLVEQGSVAELLAAGGRYARLHSLQASAA